MLRESFSLSVKILEETEHLGHGGLGIKLINFSPVEGAETED